MFDGIIRVNVLNSNQHVYTYSRTPLIRKLVIRIANYPDRHGPSAKHFLTVIVHLFMASTFHPIIKYILGIMY